MNATRMPIGIRSSWSGLAGGLDFLAGHVAALVATGAAGAIAAGAVAGGGGLRYLAYSGPSFRLSPFAQLHYGAGIEGDEDTGDFDLLQGDLGLLVAGRIPLADGLELEPYAGPMLSIVRVDADAGDADEDSLVGAVAGLALVMPDRNSVRIEAQFFDEVSISAGFSIVFQ